MANTLTGSLFTFEEAKALLANAHRVTLDAREVGDAMVDWMLEDRFDIKSRVVVWRLKSSRVAYGYFDTESRVTVLRDSFHMDTSFTGDEAQQLRQMCKTYEYC